MILVLLVTVLTTSTKFNQEELSKRIEKISANLQDSSSELSKIQKQLEERIDFVENLKKEAEIAENVISLSEEQVNAVQAKLNKELETSSSKSFWQSFLTSALFFVMGLLIPVIISKFRKRKQPEESQVTSMAEIQAANNEMQQSMLKMQQLIAKQDETMQEPPD